jgi:glycosyltransferase involved in cell wall biosynthesis
VKPSPGSDLIEQGPSGDHRPPDDAALTKHVVIDARAALPQVDGLGNYLRQHVPGIVAARQFRTTLLVSPQMLSFWENVAPAATLVQSDCRPMWTRQHWAIPRILSQLQPHLFFYPAHDPPLLLRTPFIFTIHDLSAHEVRPYFERYDRTKTAYLHFVTGRSLARARAVFAVSEATKNAIARVFGEAAKRKTIVTLNAASVPKVRRNSRRERRFLYVGTDRPHKNLPRLLNAYALAVSRVPSLPPLEIVGALRRERELRQIISRLGLTERIILKGHVSTDALEDCYAAAIAVVLPSLSEGFCMPIIEAMQRDVPVVTSAIPACSEVAGGAALRINPLRVEEIAAALSTVYSDAGLRRELVRRGRERVQAFDWERSTRIIVATIKSALNRQ